MSKKKKLILGIESSCDETGLAVVEKEKGELPQILINLVFSQEQLHRQTQGIVPEIAAREQVTKIFPMLRKLNSQLPLEKIDGIGVSYSPGLVGSLLVGVNLAKTLAYSLQKPVVKVNHLKAHLYGAFLYNKSAKPKNNKPNKVATTSLINFPVIGMVVSGGHTSLMLMEDHQKIKLLGQTLDDAAGEAFDKVAALLNLGYPGGPAIEEAGESADPNKNIFSLPRPLIDRDNLDFSFSGLKTAVLCQVKKLEEKNKKKKKSDQKLVNQLAWEFQEAVVEVLVEKLTKALLETPANSAILGGGVVANQRLREEIKKSSLPIIIPPIKLCTDNGAMVAARASYLLEQGKETPWAEIEVQPSARL